MNNFDCNPIMQYYENTPENYEPTFFRPSSSDELRFEDNGKSKVMKVKIGHIETASHSMDVRYAGIELMDIDIYIPPAVQAKSYAGEERKDGMEYLSKSLAAMKTVPSAHPDNLDDTQNDDSVVTFDQGGQQKLSYSTIRDYVLSERKASIAECSKALGMNNSIVREAFQRMMEDGLIKIKGRKYIVSDGITNDGCESQVIDIPSAQNSDGKSRIPFKSSDPNGAKRVGVRLFPFVFKVPIYRFWRSRRNRAQPLREERSA